MGLKMGIDVGGTKMAFGLYDENMQLIDKLVLPSDASLMAEPFAATVASGARQLAKKHGVTTRALTGIGIGLPSFIKFDEGYVIKTTNLVNFKEFAARDYFKRTLNDNIVLDNDANTAALAEFKHGAGRGFEHMLYCPMSTGISNGIIINGRLFRGSYGWAGETGHAIITLDEGVMCGCGVKGCFMSHVSGSMIVKHVQQKLDEGAVSIMPGLAGGRENITAKTIKQGCEQGDALALWALEHMSKYAGVWLYNLYQTFNINCYVFGGGLVHFGPLLFDKIFETFYSLNKDPLPVYFKFAELGQDFGIIGAAELIED